MYDATAESLTAHNRAAMPSFVSKKESTDTLPIELESVLSAPPIAD